MSSINSELAFDIITIIVRVAVAAFAIYVLPTVKKWLDGIMANKWAREAVNAAQQVMARESGEERKDYALGKLKEALYAVGIRLTGEQIDTLIESAVKELRIAEGRPIPAKENGNVGG